MSSAGPSNAQTQLAAYLRELKGSRELKPAPRSLAERAAGTSRWYDAPTLDALWEACQLVGGWLHSRAHLTSTWGRFGIDIRGPQVLGANEPEVWERIAVFRSELREAIRLRTSEADRSEPQFRKAWFLATTEHQLRLRWLDEMMTERTTGSRVCVRYLSAATKRHTLMSLEVLTAVLRTLPSYVWASLSPENRWRWTSALVWVAGGVAADRPLRGRWQT
jgi:hypothetical protein